MFSVTFKRRKDTSRHTVPRLFPTLEEAEADARELVRDKAILWARVRDETGKTVQTFVRHD
jgi:hypothetical protein